MASGVQGWKHTMHTHKHVIIQLQPLTGTQSLTRRAHYHCCDVFHLQVNVPSSVNEAAMQRCWQALKALEPGLEKSELLYKLACWHHARPVGPH